MADTLVPKSPIDHFIEAQTSDKGIVVPWAVIIPLVLQYGSMILPIVLADIATKKTFAQILADITAVLFPSVPVSPPVLPPLK